MKSQASIIDIFLMATFVLFFTYLLNFRSEFIEYENQNILYTRNLLLSTLELKTNYNLTLFDLLEFCSCNVCDYKYIKSFIKKNLKVKPGFYYAFYTDNLFVTNYYKEKNICLKKVRIYNIGGKGCKDYIINLAIWREEEEGELCLNQT